MKELLNSLKFLCLVLFVGLSFTACNEDDNPDEQGSGSTFENIESPYLICASRNPGGVGFDFVYSETEGGANNMDSLSVDDFAYDLKIRTIKGEKTDGSNGGSPFIQLHEDAMAVNYSAIVTTCVGITKFNALSASDLQSYSLSSDDTSFDVSDLETGDTGCPLMSALNKEYKKLVIGQTWKTTANNEIDEDELIWIVQTREGDLVKFIVTDFPAAGAPTTTGYIAITWDYLD